MKTIELAQKYADSYEDVYLVRVAKNGKTATFRSDNREFTKSRKQLESVEVVETPYGAVEVET